MENSQGGHELLYLQTNKFVKHRNLTKIPITSSIIKQVHALATLGDMPQVLKITNKANNAIFNSACIAGVDYDEQSFEDDEYEEEEDTDKKDKNGDDYEYEKMDENEVSNILQDPNHFQVPHETEEEQEIVFEEAEENSEEDVFGDSEGDHEPED